MKIQKLINQYVNRREPHPRKVGRYWASNLWAIVNNRLKPEDFLKEERMSLTSCGHIIRGEEKEDTLKKIFDANKVDYTYQKKKVLKLKGFELVIIVDFLFKDMVLELKSPRTMPDEIKQYHYPQLEAQYRAFNKPVFICYINSWPTVKCYRYAPSKKLWETILTKVEEFHKKLK